MNKLYTDSTVYNVTVVNCVSTVLFVVYRKDDPQFSDILLFDYSGITELQKVDKSIYEQLHLKLNQNEYVIISSLKSKKAAIS